MLDNDGHHNGGSSRCLLAAVRTVTWHLTTAKSSSVRYDLAILHDTADGRAVGAVSLLSRSAARHVLGSVSLLLVLRLIK